MTLTERTAIAGRAATLRVKINDSTVWDIPVTVADGRNAYGRTNYLVGMDGQEPVWVAEDRIRFING